MNSNTPRAFFSMIVPVYNTPKEYLDCCINSLTGQTLSEIEIILVDDGSGEPCRTLCDEYCKADGRIRVIHQENQGVSAARNRGIEEASADWIMFVDGDDWLEQDACLRLKEHLEQQECDILQFGAVQEYPGRQEKLRYGYEAGRIYDTNQVSTRETLYRRVMGVRTVNGERLCTAYYSWDKVFRRAFLTENSLQYPVGVPKSEDKVFILTCMEKLGTMRFVDESLYHYRLNAASAIHKYSENADINCIVLAEKLMPIARRMDCQLSELKGESGYKRITGDCRRFVFGIISDVLFLKFYHPDCPLDRKSRRTQALEFLSREPFGSVIRECPYSELSGEAKLKKLLLSHGYVSLFCTVYRLYKRLLGKAVR